MKKYLFILLFLSSAASSQQSEQVHVPLSDEAKNVFSQAIFLSRFTNLSCEEISANNPLIENAIEAIRNLDYQIAEYTVILDAEETFTHKFYVRTFDPPALIQLLIMSKQGQCDDFSFSLILEEL